MGFDGATFNVGLPRRWITWENGRTHGMAPDHVAPHTTTLSVDAFSTFALGRSSPVHPLLNAVVTAKPRSVRHSHSLTLAGT